MTQPYYQPDLAWVHQAGYSQHVERVARGILRLLREAGLPAGGRVLDVGCGSGALARKLVDAGYTVHGIDASPAMIDLARTHAPAASFDVVALPTRRTPGTRGALPNADAVISTGHVLNYLDSRDDIAQALTELAEAVNDRAGAMLAIDLMTERFANRSDATRIHARVEDDWTIVTRFSRPEPYRFDRAITVFRRAGDLWRRSDEAHHNVTFETDAAARILRDRGLEPRVREAFGDESLPEGLVVVVGVRG